jgi:hypothetical protein
MNCLVYHEVVEYEWSAKTNAHNNMIGEPF